MTASPEDFFSNVGDSDARSEHQRRAVDEARRLLARLQLPFVGPAQATATTELGALELLVAHSLHDTSLVLQLWEDGETSLHWPGGALSSAGGWTSALEETFEALLVGRNAGTIYLRRGTLIAIDTEIWSAAGHRRALPRFRPDDRQSRLMRFAPWPARALPVSVSFEREEVLGPPAEGTEISPPDWPPMPGWAEWVVLGALVAASRIAITEWTTVSGTAASFIAGWIALVVVVGVTAARAHVH